MSILSKKDVLTEMMSTGRVVRLQLDAKTKGTKVPMEYVHKDGIMLLELCYNFPVPMQGFEITDDAVEVTLSFSRTPYHCVIPWKAVRSLQLEQELGVVWFDSEEDDGEEQKPEEPKEGPQTPFLRVVKGAPDASRYIEVAPQRA